MGLRENPGRRKALTDAATARLADAYALPAWVARYAGLYGSLLGLGDLMTALEYVLVGLPLVFAIYAYLGYPVLLRLVSLLRPAKPRPADPEQWPSISISVPAYNEEASIRGTIESLLALDYPRERRQIVIISDASTDRTDEIVREYADHGVDLLRLGNRSGKTAAENAGSLASPGRYLSTPTRRSGFSGSL